MKATMKQRALVHVARRELGLSDAEYRQLLMDNASVESSRDLDAASFESVLWALKGLGFAVRRKNPDGLNDGRPGMATGPQLALIRNLWMRYHGRRTPDAQLDAWIRRTFGRGGLRMVGFEDASRVIAALRAMTERAEESRREEVS